MRRIGKLQCTRDILSSFKLFPVDYLCRRYCVFQEDAIMTQQTTPRLKSVVTTTTICVILALLCCKLPQADSLGSDCYTITGVDYRGTQDKIGLPPDAGDFLKFTDCLPWNTSVESTKPRARERGIGDHNYCRNPDGDIMPWCKVAGIQGTEGAWGYCHLPTCKVPGYVGCFPNRGNPSALDGFDILHKDMTISACIDLCRRNGFKYAGLEAGHACSCGDSGYSRYGQSADRGTHCATKCFGNKQQPCGGDGFVDVYRSDIGSCGTGFPLRTPSGAVYSPGYPDYPGSPAMMTSLGATEVMIRKHKEATRKDKHKKSELDENMDKPSKNLEINCDWTVDIKKASEIKLLIRKTDLKRRLGGAILITASDGASVVVVTSENSNVTSSAVWITESTASRRDVEVLIPSDESAIGSFISDTLAKEKFQWSTELTKQRLHRYTLRANSLDSKVSIMGGAFTVRFLRDSDLIASLKSAYEFPRTRSRGKRKQTGAEWSRFVVEYEASFPDGVTYTPYNDVTSTEKKSEGRRNKEHKKNKSDRPQQQNTDTRKDTIAADALGKTKFSISLEDAYAIERAVSSASAELDLDSPRGQGSNSPIKIEVFVEPVDSSSEKKPDTKPPMSEFMIPLLLAVLLTTTAILILSAVLVFIRRGGRSSTKNEKGPRYSPGLVVACPRDGDREKSGSTSNLSSSSTADSVLLTDSESSRHSPKPARRSPPPVSPETIKDLMEFLKNQPGIIQSHPLLEADQYKQISQPHFFAMGGDSRHDDVTLLPGPCAHCCGCSDDNHVHRHGDSCRAHHNQGKNGRPQTSSLSRPSGGKIPRGLSIRTNKPNAGAQPMLAPPLSPISEVSSVTSSMMSLPITSGNSQTSLLKQAPKSSPRKVSKSAPPPVASEVETHLVLESDTESGICEPSQMTDSKFLSATNITGSKLKLGGKISEKLVPGRYLGGIAGACYDSGYATSNYEEEEEKTRSDVKLNETKSFSPSGVMETSNVTEP